MQYPSEKFLLRHISSLHIFLQSANIKNINIMPFGQMNDGKLQSLLTKYKSIEFVNKMKIINRKRIYSCRIHHILGKGKEEIHWHIFQQIQTSIEKMSITMIITCQQVQYIIMKILTTVLYSCTQFLKFPNVTHCYYHTFFLNLIVCCILLLLQ